MVVARIELSLGFDTIDVDIVEIGGVGRSFI